MQDSAKSYIHIYRFDIWYTLILKISDCIIMIMFCRGETTGAYPAYGPEMGNLQVAQSASPGQGPGTSQGPMVQGSPQVPKRPRLAMDRSELHQPLHLDIKKVSLPWAGPGHQSGPHGAGQSPGPQETQASHGQVWVTPAPTFRHQEGKLNCRTLNLFYYSTWISFHYREDFVQVHLGIISVCLYLELKKILYLIVLIDAIFIYNDPSLDKIMVLMWCWLMVFNIGQNVDGFDVVLIDGVQHWTKCEWFWCWLIVTNTG